MKKKIVIFIVLVMILNLVGCQNTTENVNNGKQSATKKEKNETEPGLYKSDGTFVSWEELTSMEYYAVEWESTDDEIGKFKRPILCVENGELGAVPEMANPVDFDSYEILEGKLIVDSSITKLSERAFSQCRKLTEVILPQGITEIPYNAFSLCDDLTRIKIPSTVVTLGKYAFAGSGFKEFTIPDSVTTIEECCFYNCTSLENIILGESVKVIDFESFSCCWNLKRLVIPKSVEEIRQEAFYACRKLEEVFIPFTVTGVDFSCFNACENLKTIYCDGEPEQVSWFAKSKSHYDNFYHKIVWNTTLEEFNK